MDDTAAGARFQETQEKVTNDTVARVQLFKRLEDGSSSEWLAETKQGNTVQKAGP